MLVRWGIQKNTNSKHFECLLFLICLSRLQKVPVTFIVWDLSFFCCVPMTSLLSIYFHKSLN